MFNENAGRSGSSAVTLGALDCSTEDSAQMAQDLAATGAVTSLLEMLPCSGTALQ